METNYKIRKKVVIMEQYSKYDYDIGLDINNIFMNLNLDTNQKNIIDNLMESFKTTLITKTYRGHQYYIIPSQKIIIFSEHYYDKRYSLAMAKLLEKGFSFKDINHYLHIPISVINDLLLLFDETKKYAKDESNE